MNKISHWPNSEEDKKAKAYKPDAPIDTDKKYTLFIRGELTLNWDNIPFLQNALTTVPNSRSTYIRYNETGINEYQENRLVG